MIKFLFNFVFFGVLFYAIWLLFPDAFTTMTEWAGKIYSFIVDLITALIDFISDLTKPSTEPTSIQSQDGATFFEVR